MKQIQMGLCVTVIFGLGLVYEWSQEPDCFFPCKPIAKQFLRPQDVMSQGRSIIFLETTDHLQPSPLVLCSVESAAKIYPDRPVIFFMKGLNNNTVIDVKSCPSLFLLSTMKNVFLFHLQMDNIFQDTPLLPWYFQVNTTKEKNWAYIISDAIRLAALWKYGGIYMDTDVISIKPIPVTNFLAAQSSQFSSNGVLGFQHHHWFLWDCMKDFVHNYNGDIWGNQGPYLVTRILKKLCHLRNFETVEDHRCHNISFLHPQRFYPIPYESWTIYYKAWNFKPEFNHSYALHLWNFMNKKDKKNVTLGSNTLVENLFRTYCPTTYSSLVQEAQYREAMPENKTS